MENILVCSEGQKLSILIADDSEEIRRSLSRLFLSRYPGANVLVSRNGSEGLANTLKSKPDIVVMEISMPLMYSIEKIRKIKRVLPKTSVVILSSHDEAENRSSAKANGATAFISKQKMSSQLMPTIRRLVHEKTKIDN